MSTLGLRSRMIRTEGLERLHAVFEALSPKLDELLRAPHMRRSDHLMVPRKPGVYLFSEGERFIYVGQTRNLRQRLSHHTIPSAHRYTATFAFRIAKECAMERGIDTKVTAEQLEADGDFRPLFLAAKQRIANMDVRFIEMDDPILRTVFEVYTAVALGTDLEYNSFETH